MTQFGRVLRQLGIESIFAHSPEAKGRVERANGILQDRLIKELRYHNISTLEAANHFLERFRKDYNQRFGKPPRENLNVHRALTAEELATLDRLCTFQVKHKVSKNLTFKHRKKLYKLKITGKGHRLRQEGVLVCEDAIGKITVLYNQEILEYEVYEEHYHDNQAISRKELDALLDQMNVQNYVSHLISKASRKHF
ncbi:MAG: transposase [Francisellaceae bacterium]|nr:transposase [Francisellaceae bacterium]